MHIKGIQKTSLIDYPGKICTTIFTGGCNFRCPYCHNPELVEGHDKVPTISFDELFQILDARHKLVDALCVGGGEPCLNERLPELLRKVKEKGVFVKLDTNGTRPDMIRKLLDEKLIDFIAMDIKGPLDKYPEITNSPVDVEKIKESIELVRESGLDYEFRTTIVPKLLDREDLLKIGKMLNGSKKYVLQRFKPDKVLDPSYKAMPSYHVDEMLEFVEMLQPYFEKVDMRV